ncbi:hypothetical protein NCPPB940_04240 [Xanthomonas hortorum pv. taraxaci]|nr:hypothetical protein NCPPB940_04240 [Xanthomonas hortorum pv. taraxaci]CAD0302997.1 hypothetical protein NCPPB940_04240 [Xanthomonas hortorum pv. taraxaci]
MSYLSVVRRVGWRGLVQCSGWLGLVSLLAAGPAFAQGVPQSAALTNGINTGGTSFFDGFTRTTPGWAVVTYLRQSSLDAINDARGNDVPVFDNPRIDSTLLLTQIAYVTPYTPFGGALGINALLPLINLDASFGRNSIATLRDNGAGVGDLTFGPYLQMLPVMRDGRPVFSQRFEIDAIAPIGKFDRNRDLNSECGLLVGGAELRLYLAADAKLGNQCAPELHLQLSQRAASEPAAWLRVP